MKKNLTLPELGALVSEKLAEHGISVVLTGGAVVSIYTENEYASLDLDFVMSGFGKSVEKPMGELGFRREGKHFAHPDTHYTVEFPVGPLMVGNTPVRKVDSIENRYGVLRLLPPTECVMDRLAAYYHFKDGQGLEQAIQVARGHPIAFRRVQSWSKKEGFESRYRDFVAGLAVDPPKASRVKK